jgi:hypothetical protein
VDRELLGTLERELWNFMDVGSSQFAGSYFRMTNVSSQAKLPPNVLIPEDAYGPRNTVFSAVARRTDVRIAPVAVHR